MIDDLLPRGLEALGLTTRPGLLAALASFRAQIEAWNQQLGLLSLKGADDLVV